MRSKGQITIAKNSDRRATGSTPAARQKGPPPPPPPKKPVARLKLAVRRLPPALTEAEFFTVLGDDWRPGNGKVDWFRYCTGKIKGAAEHPRQSSVFLRVTNEANVKSFETAFLSSTFHDAKGTHKDPTLARLLPWVGFAPSQRIPSPRQRADVRQGTIDQDAEFQAFLTSLTEPIVKPAPVDSSAIETTREKVSTTPLIEALREKKSSKAKAGANRAAKGHKDEKPADKRAAATATKGKSSHADVVKATGRSARAVSQHDKKASNQNRGAGKTAEMAQTASPTTATAKSEPTRRRERGQQNIANILKKDLGLVPAQRRGAKGAKNEVAATASTTSVDGASPPAISSSSTAILPSTIKGQPDQPSRAERGKKDTSTTAVAAKGSKRERNARSGRDKDASSQQVETLAVETVSTRSTKTNASSRDPNAPAKDPVEPCQAFLKHVNSSQGITKDNVTQALSEFGVISVTVNTDRGTAMARFKDSEGLKAAISQRKVSVGQGAVEVSEFKDKSAGNKRAPRRGPAARGDQTSAGRAPSSATATAPTSDAAKQTSNNAKSADAT